MSNLEQVLHNTHSRIKHVPGMQLIAGVFVLGIGLSVLGWPQPGTGFEWFIQQLGLLTKVSWAIIGMYLIPGLALLRWLYPIEWLTRAERVCLALGISVGLPPLLLELFHTIKLPWNQWSTWFYVGIAAGALVWPRAGQSKKPQVRIAPLGWHGMSLILITGLALLVRLYAVRDLEVASWGDSVHHTMIAKLIVDQQGLFSSWQPYSTLSSLNYHFGFHSNVAWFHWLTGISVEQSTILIGQILNTWSAIMAYLLTTRLSRLRSAGLWAFVLTAFINTQPAFFVNWGRYTQLTGHILLVVTIVTWILALEPHTERKRTWIPAILASVGLFFSHYLIVIWAIVFIGAYILILGTVYPDKEFYKRLLKRSSLITLGTIGLSLPWIINLLQVKAVLNIGNSIVSGRSEVARQMTTLLPLHPEYLKNSIIWLAVIGLVVALLHRAWRLILCVLWAILLMLLVIPMVVGLPMASLVSNFAASVGLYVLITPLAGYGTAVIFNSGFGLKTLIKQPNEKIVQAWRSLGIMILLGVSFWGITWQKHIVDPNFVLFTEADAEAMEWINANTPEDARFLVVMLSAYGDRLFAGDDGGWWIPYFTQRETTMPPMLYGSELAEDPNFINTVNQLGYTLMENPLPSAIGVEAALAAGIDYMYVGAQRRPYTSHIPHNYEEMNRLPERFPIVYEHNGVTIYQLTR